MKRHKVSIKIQDIRYRICRIQRESNEISELQNTITKNHPKANQTLAAGLNSKMKRTRGKKIEDNLKIQKQKSLDRKRERK